MARIPNAENLQRRVASGLPDVTSISSAPPGLAALEEVSQSLKKKAIKLGAYESSKAEVDFLTLKTKQDRAYEQDEDYKTFDDRYTSELNKGMGEIALRISDPESRAEFINKNKLRVEQGRTRIQELAFSKERDFERASVNTNLDNLRETVLTGSPEEVSDAKLAIGSLLDTSVELGYHSEQEKGELKKSWQQSAALGRLSMMEPENQIEALKKPWAKDLPSDVKMKLKKQAEKDLETNIAIDKVDDYLLEGLDQEQALEEIEGIKDKSLRRETEKRWDYEYQKEKDADHESQRQLRDQFAYDVSKGLTVDEIKLNNPEEWEGMDSSTKMYLEGLQAESMQPVVRSNPDAVIHISELVARENWRGVAKLVKEYSDQGALSSKDKIDYAKIAIDGSMPIELTNELTNVQAVNTALTSAQIDDDDAKDLILHNIGKWRLDYIRTHNKEPDDAEREKFIDSQLLMVPEAERSFFGDTELPLYKTSDEQWELALEDIKEDEPEIAAKILEYFNPVSEKDISAQTPKDTQLERIKPSRAEIMRVYHALKDE
jgi:hypothetical protein